MPEKETFCSLEKRIKQFIHTHTMNTSTVQATLAIIWLLIYYDEALLYLELLHCLNTMDGDGLDP